MNNLRFPFLLLIIFCFMDSVCQSQKPQLILPNGHSGPLKSAVFSLDGKYILTFSDEDNSGKLWETGSYKMILNFDTIGDAIFTPDGKHILTLSTTYYTGNIKACCFEISSKRLISTINIPTDYVTSFALSPNGKYLTVGCIDGIVISWNFESGKLLYVLTGPKNEDVGTILFSPDSKFVVLGSHKTIKIRESATGKLINTLTSLEKFMLAIFISPNGKLIAGTSSEGITTVWDTHTGAQIKRLSASSLLVETGSFNSDGKQLVTGGNDSTIRVWDIKAGRVLRVLKGHKHFVEEVIYSPDDKYILSRGIDSTAILWDASTGDLLFRMNAHIAYVQSLNFSHDGKYFITAGWDNSAIIWETSSHKILARLKGHIGTTIEYGMSIEAKVMWNLEIPRTAVFSTDGKYILTSSYSNCAKVWEIATGKISNNLFGHTKQINSSDFSPDNRLIVTASRDGSVKVWEANSGKIIHNFHCDSCFEYKSAKFSADGEFILTVSSDRIIQTWETTSGKLVKEFSKFSFPINQGRFSHDGAHILTANYDSTATIIESSTGNVHRTFNVRSDNQVFTAVYSPNEKFIVTTGYFRNPILWDNETGKIVLKLKGHQNAVNTANFSHDGKIIVTAGRDRTARIWLTSSGEPLKTLKGHKGSVCSGDFSYDDKFIITSSMDNTTKIWSTETGEEIATLISFDSTDWVVQSPSGLFDASPGAMRQMYFVVNDSNNAQEPWQIIEFDQLKHRYYQPGLLPILLGYSQEKPRHVPAFDYVRLFPSKSLKIENDQLIIKLTNRGGGIGKVSVFIDNIQVKEDIRSDQDSAKHEISIALDLSKYANFFSSDTTNVIKVVAWNAEGYLSSRPDTVHYIPKSRIKKGVGVIEPKKNKTRTMPQLYGLVVGTSDYAGAHIDLKYAAIDAEAFSNALVLGASRLFGKENVHVKLLATGKEGVEPTNINILTQLGSMSLAKPEDIVVIYFSGHGVNYGGQDGLFYYLTMEADGADAIYLNDPVFRKYKALSSQDIGTCLNQIPARKKVLIIDACASGRATENLLASLSKEIPSSEKRALEFTQDATGSYLLASSAANAVSYEAGIYGHGLLTYSLLKGMRGARLEKIEEGEFIDVEQLFQYAKNEVPLMAKDISGIQEPLLKTPGTSGRLIIGEMTEEDKKKIELSEPKAIFLPCQFSNDDLEGEEIELAEKINVKLDNQSENGKGAGFQFTRNGNYPDAYVIKGKYRVKNKQIEINYILKKGDKNILSSQKVSGMVSDLDKICNQVFDKIMAAIQ
ncbi:MAG: caspase family protein [Bacteroidota bacterium]